MFASDLDLLARYVKLATTARLHVDEDSLLLAGPERVGPSLTIWRMRADELHFSVDGFYYEVASSDIAERLAASMVVLDRLGTFGLLRYARMGRNWAVLPGTAESASKLRAQANMTPVIVPWTITGNWETASIALGEENMAPIRRVFRHPPRQFATLFDGGDLRASVLGDA